MPRRTKSTYPQPLYDFDNPQNYDPNRGARIGPAWRAGIAYIYNTSEAWVSWGDVLDYMVPFSDILRSTCNKRIHWATQIGMLESRGKFNFRDQLGPGHKPFVHGPVGSGVLFGEFVSTPYDNREVLLNPAYYPYAARLAAEHHVDFMRMAAALIGEKLSPKETGSARAED